MKLLGLFAGLGCGAAIGDLERVRSKVPRAEYKSDAAHGIGKTLNGHLEKAHPNTKNCNQFTAKELQKLQTELHMHLEEAHNEIYSGVKDTRALRFANLEAHQAHWDEMNKHSSTHHLVEEMQRDGHCLDIVMWWVHHLSEAKRQELSHLMIPKMPVQRWREPTPEEGVAAAAVYGSSYNPSSTCLACHGGGMPWQNPENEPPPLPRQVNNKDRQRRCDEYYNEEMGLCNACEGIAGAYYGDIPDEGIYVDDCEILKSPKDVPEEERAVRRWPKKFAVEMRGADRWPRASASSNATCNHTTDCSPYNKEAEGLPLPPTVPVHWYASIHGLLYVDHNDGQFGGGRLRHESTYEFPSGKEGAERALSGRFGERNVHLTEIHVQTPEMAAADPADPGVMLNLNHKNMSDYNASGGDDSLVDWRRIPASDGDCVCVPDPAGLPYFEKAYDNATYLGRISFTPPWQNTGTYGPPGKKVVADHWVKWTFHMMVDIETNKPVMFSSPYGGCATYGNWSTPDEMWPESYNEGWRQNPDPTRCSDVTGAPSCLPYVKPKMMTV